MKKVFLVSGGLDSFLAYSLFAKKNDIPVFVDYMQKYVNKEYLAALKLYPIDLKFITIESFNKNHYSVELENNYIPNRNLFLASLIALNYYPDEIVISGMKDDNCSDKNIESFKEMSDIISKYSQKRIEITSPFWNTTKGEAIEMYIKKGLDKEKLLDTISCYSDTHEKMCGDCPACFRWYTALESNGIKTKLKISDKIKNEYLQKIDNYDIDRQKRILSCTNAVT